jgi:catechol 2,3-dioxygenase-like lactoylglutathione lyase family enzyme
VAASRKSKRTPKPTAVRKPRTEAAAKGGAKRSGSRASSKVGSSAAAAAKSRTAKSPASKGATRPTPAGRRTPSSKSAPKSAKTRKVAARQLANTEGRSASVSSLRSAAQPPTRGKPTARSAKRAAGRGRFAVDRLHQVALLASDLDRAVDFYREVLGLSFIDRFDPPGLAFFNLGGGLRLLLSATASEATLYFMVDDIDAAVRTLAGRGVSFLHKPAMVHRDDEGRLGKKGTEEWMAFFKDPSGNLLALVAQR